MDTSPLHSRAEDIAVYKTDSQFFGLSYKNFMFGDLPASLVIAYVTPHADFHTVISALKKLTNTIPLIALTTAGELCTTPNATESLYLSAENSWQSIVLQVFPPDLFSHINISSINLYSQDIQSENPADVEERLNKISQDIKKISLPFEVHPSDTVALSFVDGTSCSENYFTEALYRSGDFPCSFVGGSAGCALTQQKTHIFDGESIRDNIAVILFLKMAPHRSFDILKTQNFEKTDTSFYITEADSIRRYVKRINNPAQNSETSFIQTLLEYFQTTPENLANSLSGYTFGIEINNELYVRSIKEIDFKNDKISFFCDINAGDQLHLLKATAFLDKTHSDIKAFFKDKPKALGAVLNDCILRRLNNPKDLGSTKNFWPCNAAGFSTFGELLGININQTLTALVFFKTEDSLLSEHNSKSFYKNYHANISYFFRKNEIAFKNLSKLKTNIEEQNKKLAQEKEIALQTIRAKSAFLANISHELRTPLNYIVGIAQILSDIKITPDISDSIENLKKSSFDLLYLIDNLLELSQIENGMITPINTTFSPYEKIHKTLSAFETSAQEKNLTYSYRIENCPDMVFSDYTLLEKIIINILKNAISYTENGTVDASVSFETQTPELSLCTIKIKDTGIGLAQEQQARIFEKFDQADNSTTRKFGGIGLGLSITRNIITLLGGTITLQSALGKGACFEITIPLKLTESQTLPALAADLKRAHKLKDVYKTAFLLVEDQPLNHKLMAKLFEKLKIKDYVIAENGEDALERLKDKSFDIILMDCHMPKMDGYQTTEIIRNMNNHEIKNVPIIAITADTQKSNQIKCLEVGMDDYISKPFKIEDFKNTLSKWVIFEQDS